MSHYGNHRINNHRNDRLAIQLREFGRNYNPQRVIPRNNRLNDNENNRDIQMNIVNFQLLFDSFMNDYLLMLLAIDLIFVVLLICTELLDHNFAEGTIALQVCMGLYIVYLIRRYYKVTTKKEKDYISRLVFESFLWIVFLFMIRSGNPFDKGFFGAFIGVCMLLVFTTFLRHCHNHMTNSSSLSRFSRIVNTTFIGIKFLLTVQFILVIVQFATEGAIPWFILFVPGYVLTMILGIVTLKSFHLFLFSLGKILSQAMNWGKKRALYWIFLNLVGAFIIIPISLILVAIKNENLLPFDTNNISFIVIYVTIIIFCTISLKTGLNLRTSIFETTREIAVLFEMDLEDINLELDRIQRVRIGLQEQREKEEKETITYIIRISSSYFRMATKDEVEQFKKEKKAGVCCLPIGFRRVHHQPEQTPNPEELQKFKTQPSKNNLNCVICFSKNSNAVFMDCGHGGICFDCGAEMVKAKPECHMCRTPVRQILQIKKNSDKNTVFKVIQRMKVES